MGSTRNVSDHEKSSSHFLGSFFEGPINGRRIEGLRELGEDEYRRYVDDATTVLEFFSDYQQYVMVRDAYVEYLHLLERQAEALANHVHLNEVVREQIVHNVNRRLRGFFSEFRVFLEYTETKLKRRYGEGSEQLRAFKASCSRQFDGSFAYRFVYQLRNYALHVNVPLNAMSLASGEGEFDPEDPDTHNRFAIEVSRDALLSDQFDWRSDVRSGLANLPPSFELNPLIKEAMYCLEKIHLELVCVKLAREKQAAERVSALAAAVQEPGIPCVLRVDGPEEDIINGFTFYMQREEGTQGRGPNRLALHIGWIPVQAAQIVLDLPDPEELFRYENIFLDINSATPEGEPIHVPF